MKPFRWHVFHWIFCHNSAVTSIHRDVDLDHINASNFSLPPNHICTTYNCSTSLLCCTCSSSLVTLARPSSLQITDRSFRYASPCLSNQLLLHSINLIPPLTLCCISWLSSITLTPSIKPIFSTNHSHQSTIDRNNHLSVAPYVFYIVLTSQSFSFLCYNFLPFLHCQ